MQPFLKSIVQEKKAKKIVKFPANFLILHDNFKLYFVII